MPPNDMARTTTYDRNGNKSVDERELTDSEQAEKDESTRKEQIRAQLLTFADLENPTAAQTKEATQGMARLIARHLD